ncbi:MAG: methylisocitrate lyase [Nitrospinae bacterium]|nr:methylisocitrate lyase [Nitrospinota bacterium]MEC4671165.1 methylisocitrate lyase [Nitrospirota bacterium]
MLNVKTSPSAKLRELLQSGTLAVPGAFNAFSARLIEEAGFPAVYMSGAGISAGRAMPDTGLLTMTEVAKEARHISRAVQIPVIADADTGFGDVDQVYRTVQELESAGVAGIQLEDQTLAKRCGHLPGKHVISREAMCEKIASAVRAKQDQDLLIIARTDARAVEGLDRAIERAKAYSVAGADAIFPEALESAEEFQKFVKGLNDPTMVLMANMTEWGKTPLLSVDEFSNLGYHIVIFPMMMFRLMARAMEEGLIELRAYGTQKGLMGRMQTRKQLYEILRYEDYDQPEVPMKEKRKVGALW